MVGLCGLWCCLHFRVYSGVSGISVVFAFVMFVGLLVLVVVSCNAGFDGICGCWQVSFCVWFRDIAVIL